MRIRHGLAAFVPLGLFSATYLAGRLGWLQIAGTGGAAPWPSVGAFGVPLVVLGLGGLAVAAVRRQGRVTALFVAATAAQILAFYLLASRAGAPEPYMALKMFYLMLWPLAACAVLAVAELWHRVSAASTRHLSTRAESLLAIAVIAGAWALTVRPLWNNPRVLHPRPAAVTAPLYEAGRWARANVPANCLEYLVNDPETAYWLHLAVLGNRRMSPRTGDNSTYELDDALVRWLTPGGRVYAIADLPALPRDVRDELHIIRQFDTAAIAQRVGAGSCEP